eukprot:TRINITY_DN8226_c0_g1_i1.p1 TRINITY_DN8226_c0_g1~~TRINITY_DN8226_c0_g1_i1.p1  ORF type:complete len:366 (-),score=73.08 TRINITY_DN8226_c0_g1_i1:121-1218(-)
MCLNGNCTGSIFDFVCISCDFGYFGDICEPCICIGGICNDDIDGNGLCLCGDDTYKLDCTVTNILTGLTNILPDVPTDITDELTGITGIVPENDSYTRDVGTSDVEPTYTEESNESSEVISEIMNDVTSETTQIDGELIDQKVYIDDSFDGDSLVYDNIQLVVQVNSGREFLEINLVNCRAEFKDTELIFKEMSLKNSFLSLNSSKVTVLGNTDMHGSILDIHYDSYLQVDGCISQYQSNISSTVASESTDSVINYILNARNCDNTTIRINVNTIFELDEGCSYSVYHSGSKYTSIHNCKYPVDVTTIFGIVGCLSIVIFGFIFIWFYEKRRVEKIRKMVKIMAGEGISIPDPSYLTPTSSLGES